jgi:hypothetical protein
MGDAMPQNDAWEGGQRVDLATQIGLPAEALTDAALKRIAEDPVFLHRLNSCKSDPRMLRILLSEVREVTDTPQESGGTALELVGRATMAFARWSASGFQEVDDELYEQRLATCYACEHLTIPGGNALLYRLMETNRGAAPTCGLCGCDVQRKARMATERCPDGRWPRAIQEEPPQDPLV